MATLMSQTRKQTLVPRLRVADSFWSRGIGLLTTADWSEDEGLWLRPGNSIHTFFMRMTIDCVFVDRQLTVVRTYENVKPWRMIAPLFAAHSVFELPAGSIRRLSIQTGEVLYVGA